MGDKKRKRWLWVVFEGAKPHLVSSRLYPTIVADMRRRAHPPTQTKSCRSFSIDVPGMVRVDRPYETFRVMGLKVEIPSEDVVSFAADVAELKQRGTQARPYFKLHGFMRCWVLTPYQRETLLAHLRARATVAETRAKVFYAGEKSPAEVLREAAAKVSGSPIEEIPDLGGHKVDRFFAGNFGHQKRGQA